MRFSKFHIILGTLLCTTYAIPVPPSDSCDSPAVPLIQAPTLTRLTYLNIEQRLWNTAADLQTSQEYLQNYINRPCLTEEQKRAYALARIVHMRAVRKDGNGNLRGQIVFHKDKTANGPTTIPDTTPHWIYKAIPAPRHAEIGIAYDGRTKNFGIRLEPLIRAALADKDIPKDVKGVHITSNGARTFEELDRITMSYSNQKGGDKKGVFMTMLPFDLIIHKPMSESDNVPVASSAKRPSEYSKDVPAPKRPAPRTAPPYS